ncbi:MAG: hypothetical protein HC765_11190 [Brachymonas sp.]|nr:hypothetical protein [Brachymonas sp.]
MRDEHYGISVPTAAQLQQRWEQSLAQFEMWALIWRDNPQIAKQAGARVEELLMPLAQVQARYVK